MSQNAINPLILDLYHGSFDPHGMRDFREIVADIFPGDHEMLHSADFGPSTYFTNRTPQASEWAVRRGTNGWLCHFTIDISTLKILNLDPAHEPPLRWIAEIAYNRHFDELNEDNWDHIICNWRKDPAECDIILGYTTDDQYFNVFKDFFTNNLSFTGLCKAVILGNLGYQYAVRSPNAYRCLTRCPNKQVLKENWYTKYNNRKNMAKAKYKEVKRLHGRNAINELFFIQIVKDNIKPDDPLVAFPRQSLEKDDDIDHKIFEETDNLAISGIFPGAR